MTGGTTSTDNGNYPDKECPDSQASGADYRCEDCGWLWPSTVPPPDTADCRNCGGELDHKCPRCRTTVLAGEDGVSWCEPCELVFYRWTAADEARRLA